MRTHIRQYHEEFTFTKNAYESLKNSPLDACVQCGFDVTPFVNLKAHVESEHVLLCLLCNNCGYKELARAILMMHIQKYHGELTITKHAYLCEKCDFNHYFRILMRNQEQRNHV